MKKTLTLLFVALLSHAVAVNADAATGPLWEKVTSSLSLYDVLVITNADAQKEMSIGMYGTNPVGKVQSYTDEIPTGFSPLTVVAGSVQGSYAFKTIDGKYLAWYAGDYLSLSDDVYANSSWTVSIEGGTATMANVAVPARKLQYDAEELQFVASTADYSALTLWKRIPEAITISPKAGDISTSLSRATKGKKVSNITINLTEGGKYTISASIVAPGSLTINGNGATIDASGLGAAMITTPAGDLAEWMSGNLTVKDVTVKGLKKSLYASAGKNYLYNDFLVDNCVIEFNETSGLEFDFRKGGVAENFTISNSTLYALAPTSNSLYTSQSAQKGTEAPDVDVQTFTIKNSTLVNFAKTKNFFTHRQSNQKWLAYTIQNSIFVDCGKSGQVVKGINQGQSGANPTWDIDGNLFNFGGTDTRLAETTGDTTEGETVKNCVGGLITFTDAANGDFNGVVAVETVIPEALGDPRWTLTFNKTYKDITIAPAEGDITAALEAATEPYAYIGDITINLAADGEYTITKAIEAAASLTINGNGATIDASALTAAMITTPAGDLAEWMEGNLTIEGVNIKGLKKSLFASAGKNYLYHDFKIENSVIEFDETTGLEFDFRKGGVAENFTISNSTLYALNPTGNSLYTSQSAQKGTEAPGVDVQTFTIKNSTLVNFAKSKNLFTHRQSNQKWLAYTIENSIFVDCGKSGQVVKGINQGSSGANPTWIISGNLFNFDGADTSAAESTGDADEPVENSVAGVVEFTDAAEGNFNGVITLAEGAETPATVPGDNTNFTVTIPEATGIEAVKATDAADLDGAVIYNLNGQRVDKAQKGLYIINGRKVVIK